MVISLGKNFAKMLARHFTLGWFSWKYSYFLHKCIWVLFSCGGNFREEDNSSKNAKITPTGKFSRLQYCLLGPWTAMAFNLQSDYPTSTRVLHTVIQLWICLVLLLPNRDLKLIHTVLKSPTFKFYLTQCKVLFVQIWIHPWVNGQK